MVCILLVLLAGIASGLALGLLSFSQVDLEVLIKAGLPKDRKHAGYHLQHMSLHYAVFKIFIIIGIAILLYVQKGFDLW